MEMLPTISIVLLTLVAVWFVWPLIVDPIARAASGNRRDLSCKTDRTEDMLFETWAERG